MANRTTGRHLKYYSHKTSEYVLQDPEALCELAAALAGVVTELNLKGVGYCIYCIVCMILYRIGGFVFSFLEEVSGIMGDWPSCT